MAYITKDTFPIEEIKAHLVGKNFVVFGNEGHLRERVIVDVQVSLKLYFSGKLKKALLNPIINVVDNKGRNYNLHEIWLDSVEEYDELKADMYLGAVNVGIGKFTLPTFPSDRDTKDLDTA
jgi:hypothetical protein